ncbi:MAG: aldehyde dehydrogenase [Phycisphaerae bacterium]|nr:aldehyde dehydrogenase [Phycisphaerae bacterium]
MQRIGNYVGGEIVPPVNGQWMDNVDPAVGKPYALTPASDKADVDRAVAAAEAAFPAWSATSVEERAAVLMRLGEAIDRRKDQLAMAECIDGGKPITRARDHEIPRVLSNFRYFAAAIQHNHSELYPGANNTLNMILRRPRGVVGLISPWNLPLYLLTWKIAPAIATGNTCVAKPSEVTPMTAHLFAEICREAELPAGVVNIVHGRGAEAGAALINHESIRTVSFTGGTATGRAIASAVAPGFKKLSLELGGKNPTIIFDDAPGAALQASVMAAFANTGQICLCGSRILVQQTIFESFVKSFVQEAEKLRVGDPLDSATQIGALVSHDQLQKSMRYAALAREEGGRILLGGERFRPAAERCREGFFFSPTVVVGLDSKARTCQEEIFGPIVTIAPFRDLDHAIALANDTGYGLSASVWTQNIDKAHRVAGAVDCGTVWINCWLVRDLRVPFGGTKQSGLGREGGDEALRFFTEPKNVCLRVN